MDENWQEIGPLAAVAEGLTRTRAGAIEVLLVRQGDFLRAFVPQCPHQGGPLAQGWLVPARSELVCPWHRFRFRLEDGSSVTNPAMKLTCIPVTVVDGQVCLGGQVEIT